MNNNDHPAVSDPETVFRIKYQEAWDALMVFQKATIVFLCAVDKCGIAGEVGPKLFTPEYPNGLCFGPTVIGKRGGK